MLRLVICLVLLAPITMGASMCGASEEKKAVEKTDTSDEPKTEGIPDSQNPMKKIPKEYEKSIDTRNKNLEKSMGDALGEEGK